MTVAGGLPGEDDVPQVVELMLERVSYVEAVCILFQKDSASYKHKVETSRDGCIGNFCMNGSVRVGSLSRYVSAER